VEGERIGVGKALKYVINLSREQTTQPHPIRRMGLIIVRPIPKRVKRVHYLLMRVI